MLQVYHTSLVLVFRLYANVLAKAREPSARPMPLLRTSHTRALTSMYKDQVYHMRHPQDNCAIPGLLNLRSTYPSFRSSSAVPKTGVSTNHLFFGHVF